MLIKSIIGLLILSMFISCSSYHYKRIDAQSYTDIQVGTSVQIKTHDGRNLEFDIIAIDDNLISGDKHEVRFNEILCLKTLQLNNEHERSPGIFVTVLAIGFVALLGFVVTSSKGK